MSAGLVERVKGLATSLSGPELNDLKLLLGMAVGNLATDCRVPTEPTKAAAFDVAMTCLAAMQPHADRVTPAGYLYKGRPPFVTDEFLQIIQQEAVDSRASAIWHDSHHLGCGGAVANRFAVSEELVQFVVAHAGTVTPTAIASYLYYEQPGEGLPPHIDTEVFSINCLLMLRHRSISHNRSNLVLFTPAGASRVSLEPGEMIVFMADSVVHARESVSPGEEIQILTIGFQPA